MHEDQLRGDCDKKMIRTSLVNQWLRLCTSNTGAWVPSLVRELRSHLQHSAAPQKKMIRKIELRWWCERGGLI